MKRKKKHLALVESTKRNRNRATSSTLLPRESKQASKVQYNGDSRPNIDESSGGSTDSRICINTIVDQAETQTTIPVESQSTSKQDLSAKYAAIESLEERAFQVLLDLGMVEMTSGPSVIA